MNELISVIIPVYNVEKYLHKCIDSVIGQTYANIEVILVDDGSTDFSGKICDEYALKDERIKVIHKQNGGQAIARNCALDIMTGDYIAFVDSDDYIEDDMLEVMLRTLREYDCDVVQCGVKFNNPLRGKIQEVRYCNEIETGNTDLLIYNYLENKVTNVIWNKLYRANVFKDIRFPEVRCREDIYIMHEVLNKCKKFALIPECKYIQYIRNGSTERSALSDEKIEVTNRAINRLVDFVNTEFPHYSHMVSLLKAETYFGYLKGFISGNVNPKSTRYANVLSILKNELSLVNCDNLEEKDMAKYYEMMNFVNHPFISREKYKFKSFVRSSAKKMISIIKGI